ncbi:DoxX family protein [Nonomuraea sp. 3N208]|uniref:DoxX family protein n=1 Tax=Nonomuraea sp. 3N208 TaxID=3457421 RepID=UPI003FD58603
MKILVWIVSGLAAFIFVSTGLPKVTASAAELTAMYESIPVVLLKIAGVAEILGGLGLIVPAATRILPVLTPIAAGGLVLTMLGAIITNIAIGEYATILISLPYLVAAAGILWARSTRYAIAPRKKTAAQPPTS